MKKSVALFLALFVVFSGCALLKNRFDASVDKPSGTIKIKGIQDKVSISRDKLGIPYIEASNEQDLFFAVGYAMASDRLWQMYLRSMAMQGRLSEIAGESMLNTDIYFRTLGLKKQVDEAYASLDSKSIQTLESYSMGVNEYLKENKDLPAEFVVTGFTPPPWTPKDSLYAFCAMGYGLAYNIYEELDFLVLAAKLGYEKLNWLFPVSPDMPLPADEINKLNEIPSSELMGNPIITQDSSSFMESVIPKPMPASNNWALMGSKTLNGKTIVCNDTHLMPMTPSNWIIMNLKCPTYKAAGVLVPGLPIVVLGFNGNVAWGVTMVCSDSQDLFVEKLKIDNGTLYYLYKDEWLKADTQKETFNIKSKKPVEKIISSTIHGPLLNTNVRNVPLSPEIMPEKYGLALSWALQGMPDTFAGFYELAGAGNVNEARKCILKIGGMYLNFIFGDAENIGWQVSGICPVRKKGKGMLPSPGWTGEYDWSGYAGVDKMPFGENPQSGYLATANNEIVRPDYPVMISSSWAKPERIQRINSLLAPMKNATTGDMITMQFDRYSLMANKVQKMLYEGDFSKRLNIAVDKLNPEDKKKATKCLELLAPDSFDCVMKPISIYAAVMGAFYHTATINTFMDEFVPLPSADLKAVENLTKRYSSVKASLDKIGKLDSAAWKSFDSLNKLGYSAPEEHLIDREDSPFWDDARTKIKVETKADIIAASLADAVSLCEKRMGPDPRDWRWGTLLNYIFKHDISEDLPFGAFEDYFNPGRYPAGGDWHTINQAGFSWTDDTFNVIEIPAMRMIVNFGEPEPVSLVTVPGESGNPSSPHYKDMVSEYFLTGKNYPLPFNNDDNIKKQYTDVFMLVPVK